MSRDQRTLCTRFPAKEIAAVQQDRKRDCRNDMDEEQGILQICQITGTTPEKARQYLSVSDGNVEHAISLFLESGGADLGPAIDADIIRDETEAPATRLDEEMPHVHDLDDAFDARDAVDDDEIEDTEPAGYADFTSSQRHARNIGNVRDPIAPFTDTLLESTNGLQAISNAMSREASRPPRGL